jgi:tripartite-type tricarboxylate transporter receptor subunit TctC
MRLHGVDRGMLRVLTGCALTRIFAEGLAMRALVRFVCGLAAAIAVPAAAHAEWPERPVRVVVPYTAGSMGDVIARIVSDNLQTTLGQAFIIDNRTGAGGNIGARAVEQSAPDGYTLLLAATNNVAINQFLYKDMGFDPLKRFDPVTVLVDVPSVIFVNADLPAHSFSEFVAYARANRGKLNYGSPGIGTTPHLSAAAIDKKFDLGMTHVPYRGASQVVTALVAGDVQFYLAGAGVGAELVKQGRLRALAVSNPSRLAALPDTPTFAEAGIDGINATNWWGVLAPAGTPRPVIDRLYAALCRSLADAKTKTTLDELGDVPVCNTPDQMARQLAEEASFWQRALPELGVKLD